MKLRTVTAIWWAVLMLGAVAWCEAQEPDSTKSDTLIQGDIYMSDICPKCGKIMVEKPPTEILTSYPPQWRCIMWCGCGYTEDRGLVRGKTAEESMQDEWERINGIRRKAGE